MDTEQDELIPAPCFARPYAGFLHPEGRCECFFGGPAPEFEQPDLTAA